MRLLIDTNRYTDRAQGKPDVEERMESADEVWLPVIVLGELRAGFAAGTKTAENEGVLQHFLFEYDVRLLPIDEATTAHYAFVYSTLRRKGKMIPTNDVWIAALALQYYLTLTRVISITSTFPV